VGYSTAFATDGLFGHFGVLELFILAGLDQPFAFVLGLLQHAITLDLQLSTCGIAGNSILLQFSLYWCSFWKKTSDSTSFGFSQ
jgi:hypothetical protein